MDVTSPRVYLGRSEVVHHPVDLEDGLVPQLNEGGHTAEQSDGATRLEHNFVGVDEEGTLPEDVGVKVLILDFG